jgi:hypothetical protein
MMVTAANITAATEIISAILVMGVAQEIFSSFRYGCDQCTDQTDGNQKDEMANVESPGGVVAHGRDPQSITKLGQVGENPYHNQEISRR